MFFLETVSDITTASIFTEAGEVMAGFIKMAGNFFVSMWGNPMGRVAICTGLVASAIGLGYKLFFRKRHI